MIEYGETYLYHNRVMLRRFRLRCQINNCMEVYRLAQHMAQEEEEE